MSLDHRALKNRSYSKAQMRVTEPAKCRRAHNPDSKAITPPPKARCCGCRSSSFTTEKAKPQTQITHLTADYGAFQQECDYVRNAYDGLKQKHDQLTTERANEIDRENELRHKLEVSNETVTIERAWKERVVQQIAVVEAEFTQYRTAMVQVFSQGQDTIRALRASRF
jgi:chromosome segregation ATPase